MKLYARQLNHILFNLVWQLYENQTYDLNNLKENVYTASETRRYGIKYSDTVNDLFQFEIKPNDPLYSLNAESKQNIDIIETAKSLYDVMIKMAENGRKSPISIGAVFGKYGYGVLKLLQDPKSYTGDNFDWLWVLNNVYFTGNPEKVVYTKDASDIDNADFILGKNPVQDFTADESEEDSEGDEDLVSIIQRIWKTPVEEYIDNEEVLNNTESKLTQPKLRKLIGLRMQKKNIYQYIDNKTIEADNEVTGIFGYYTPRRNRTLFAGFTGFDVHEYSKVTNGIMQTIYLNGAIFTNNPDGDFERGFVKKLYFDKTNQVKEWNSEIIDKLRIFMARGKIDDKWIPYVVLLEWLPRAIRVGLIDEKTLQVNDFATNISKDSARRLAEQWGAVLFNLFALMRIDSYKGDEIVKESVERLKDNK